MTQEYQQPQESHGQETGTVGQSGVPPASSQMGRRSGSQSGQRGESRMEQPMGSQAGQQARSEMGPSTSSMTEQRTGTQMGRQEMGQEEMGRQETSGMQQGTSQQMGMRLSDVESPEQRTAVEDIARAIQVCEWCADQCIQKADPNMIECIRLCEDVSEIGEAALVLVPRNSRYAEDVLQAFHRAVQECGRECSHHLDGHCQECSEVLGLTADSVGQLLGQGGQQAGTAGQQVGPP